MKGLKFLRQNWFRLKRLGMKWRRPRGSQSKLRKQKKGRPAIPKIGYKKPESERGLVAGERPVLVRRVEDIGQAKAIIIASGVGLKKLIEIYNHCKEKDIRVVNHKKFRRVLEKLRGVSHGSEKPEGAGEQNAESGKE